VRAPVRISIPLLLAALVAAPVALAHIPTPADEHQLVRTLTIPYTAHDGVERTATVLLPAQLPDTPLPLVISPHGRGLDGAKNARVWGDLPGRDGFVVVSPDGEGRKLGDYSWGDPGQIDDLARMPQILEEALPGLHIDPGRIYAMGGSMGGQEVLLLLATHPQLLAGVAAFDPATDMAERYYAFAQLRGGRTLQRLARKEIGGTPTQVPEAYAIRSPDAYAEQIAVSGVPLQIWWSTRDKVIRHQWREAGALYRQIHALNPTAPVEQCRGEWRHTVEMDWDRRLPQALRHFGLVPADSQHSAGTSRYRTGAPPSSLVRAPGRVGRGRSGLRARPRT
jgi:poly(3-hydroxybutyrate) depolymerase